MNKIKEFIQRIKGFFQENPKRAKLIGIIVVLAIIPLTIVAALTVQNLTQHAGGGPTLRITDASGITITETTSPFVFVALNLPSDWVLPSSPQSNNGLVSKVYAADSQCTPPYSGYLGCFTSDAFPSGSICTGSCTTTEGQDGQFCYTSTNVGNTCTNDSGLLGTCNSQGTCVASAAPPPTSTPIPTPTSIPTEIPTTPPSSVTLPQHNTNTDCNGVNCSTIPGTTCVNTGTPAWAPYHCEYQTTPPPAVPTSTPRSIPTIPPSQPRSTSPTKHVLKQIEVSNPVYQPNEKNDGSPLKVINIATESDFPSSFSWELNTLPSDQNYSFRLVQVAFIATDGFRVDSAAQITLKRIQAPSSAGSSVFMSGSSVFNPVFTSGSSVFTSLPQSFNLDLDGNGLVNDYDIRFLNSQYGKKGTGSTAALNHNGVIDGISINLYLRAYGSRTPNR